MAGGMAVGFRQRGKDPGRVLPPTMVTPAGMPAELSHVWSTGVGRVAPTNRLKRSVAPFVLLRSVAGSVLVVRASTIAVASFPGNAVALA